MREHFQEYNVEAPTEDTVSNDANISDDEQLTPAEAKLVGNQKVNR